MTDLTKNKEAFGLMDEADQNALRALPVDQIEALGEDGWFTPPPHVFFNYRTYRQKPEPTKPMIEARSGVCWVEARKTMVASAVLSQVEGYVKSTYTQTTVNGKFARCVITAEGYTPTLTDEQAREVARKLCVDPTYADVRRVRETFAAFVKTGVM